MPRSPLTETIKRAEGMVHYVQENLNSEEYMLFLDMVDPLPEPVQKPTKKKSSKKSAGGGGRSSRGTSIKNQLSNRRQEQPTPTYCAHVSDDGDDPTQCGESESSGIHDATMDYRNYHPFQPPVTTTASGGGG